MREGEGELEDGGGGGVEAGEGGKAERRAMSSIHRIPGRFIEPHTALLRYLPQKRSKELERFGLGTRAPSPTQHQKPPECL